MLEEEIKDFCLKHNLKHSNIYNELKLSKQIFYKALKSNKTNNPTLLKILNFLGLEIIILLKEKDENIKKSLLSSTGRT